MAYLLQLLNSTFALIAFLFYLGFLKLKPQYREKKNSLMFYFFLGSGIIQIGNFFNQNYYVIVTLLYFTYQIYFMVKYFEGDFFFKMFVFFINKIMDILVMALWERFLVMAIEQKWSIFYRQIIDPNNPSQEHYAYSLVTLLILMVLYVVVNYITYILLKRILTLKIKFTGSIFVLVPVSQIALFASFLMLYYRANRLNIPSNAFGWLGCAVAIIGDVLLVITYRDLRKTDRIEATLAFLEQQQQSGFDELKNITAIEKRQQIINHDLKNQLVTATMLLSENKIEAAKESLNALSDIIKTSEKRIYCENSVVNAVINYKVTLAQKDEITINSKLFLPEDILISSMDLCSVFSNVLDNSMRAVKDYYEDADRVINLVCAASNGYLVIKSDNAAKEKLDIKGNLIATSKENPEMHGYGLMIMENIAAKYNGKMSIKQENDRFYFEMLLSLEESAADKNKGK